MRLHPILLRVTLPLAATLAALVVPSIDPGQAAQAPGFAEIDSPTAAQSLSGMVTIVGSANHPAFVSYDLSFGYADDETGTWFMIAESIPTPVIDGPLALWDTRNLSDETYDLKLEVLLDDGSRLEALVSDLQVRNYTPTSLPRPDQSTPAPTVTPPNPPLPTAEIGAPPSAPPGAEQVVLSYLRFGMAAGVASLLAVGIVVFGRRAWRWGQASIPRRRSRRGRRRRGSRR